jgi:hypothetical protein
LEDKYVLLCDVVIGGLYIFDIILSIALYVLDNPGVSGIVNPGGKVVIVLVELEYVDLDRVEDIPGYLVTA